MLSTEQDKKLSIEECKKHLPANKYTDAQVEEMKDGLYQLATILIDEFKSKAVPDLMERSQSQIKI
jgi:hypothetical protein